MRKFFNMPVGTRSLLYGVHTPIIHSVVITIAWFKLFGFRRDVIPKANNIINQYFLLLLCFIFHDIGYWGCKNMDGYEGEMHPVRGANLIFRIASIIDSDKHALSWRTFCIFHSRSYAKLNGTSPSALCFADKAAIYVEPSWLYIPRAFLSKEIFEYMDNAKKKVANSTYMTQEEKDLASSGKMRKWSKGVKSYFRRWVSEEVEKRYSYES